MTESGRVVDTANGMVSHTEGQGYGLLLAVAANDRPTFERIWGWTRANLAVRNDELFAWRWEPDHRPAVADLNDAADGDILIAWALAEAADAWSEDAYRVAGRRIAVDVGRRLILWKSAAAPCCCRQRRASRWRTGRTARSSTCPITCFPHSPGPVGRAGVRLGRSWSQRAAPHRGEPLRRANLPVEWMSLTGGKPHPAEGFAGEFAYNAIRIPLYFAWSGAGRA